MTVDSFLMDENEEEALLFAGDESHYDDPDDEEDYFDPDNEDFDPYDLEDDVHASDWVRGSNWNGDV
tara:strand:+ start:1077 stop:1277 length:201 start_codon:yes stop_codon:yes gene_type:complete